MLGPLETYLTAIPRLQGRVDSVPARESVIAPRSAGGYALAAMWSHRSFPFVLLAAICLCLASPVTALDESDPASGWAFSLGVFDFAKFQETAEFGIEYRWQPFELFRLELKPTVGVSATADEGYWGHVGLRWDIPTKGGRWIPSLAFAVTAYEQGDGKNLGGTLQFRSAFDLAYRLDSGSRVGVSVYHLSNASIHDFNPGSESIVLFWSLGR
ncbi:MAG: acyloxyacyl hydrolase [Thermoanaerobaculia bacterium]|nr:acyloxyacyl hydrolase [Thermoanaerobaculia bacterium]